MHPHCTASPDCIELTFSAFIIHKIMNKCKAAFLLKIVIAITNSQHLLKNSIDFSYFLFQKSYIPIVKLKTDCKI